MSYNIIRMGFLCLAIQYCFASQWSVIDTTQCSNGCVGSLSVRYYSDAASAVLIRSDVSVNRQDYDMSSAGDGYSWYYDLGEFDCGIPQVKFNVTGFDEGGAVLFTDVKVMPMCGCNLAEWSVCDATNSDTMDVISFTPVASCGDGVNDYIIETNRPNGFVAVSVTNGNYVNEYPSLTTNSLGSALLSTGLVVAGLYRGVGSSRDDHLLIPLTGCAATVPATIAPTQPSITSGIPTDGPSHWPTIPPTSSSDTGSLLGKIDSLVTSDSVVIRLSMLTVMIYAVSAFIFC